MTLFKQIAIMLSIFLLIILATVLTLNFQSANKSVQDRLYEDAKNSATSLSLSLGNANGDISMMSTMINANFDSGYYREITLVDVENITLYERKTESEIIDIPSWFLNMIEIEAPIARANVSAGWSQVGILSVQSDTTYAYKQLYSILKSLLISFALISVIGLIILNLLLHAVLKPLKEVQKQAAAVIRNEFIIQDNIPYTTEFRDVVLGMNNMVSKVKAMFDKGNKELKAHKELEYIDKNTGLRNRKYLIDRLPEYLKVDAPSKGGINILIAISGMMQANEKLGHQNADKLLLDIADIFRDNSKVFTNCIVARMNGTEFSMLLPDCSKENALELAKKIYDSVEQKIIQNELNTNEIFISLGLYEYSHRDTISQLFSRSDNSLAQAKFHPSNIHLEKAEDSVEVMGKEAWKLIINNAIEKNRFSFVSWPVVDTKSKKLANHVLSINLTLDKNTSYSYAQFMAPAIQSGLSNDIYKNVVNMLFKIPDMLLSASTYSLRLPYEYLEHEGTFEDISELLRANAATLPFKLIIEMPDRLVRQDSKHIMEYKELFKMYNIDVGVFEFIGESEDYQYLQDLRPVYIKGESSYFLTQTDQSLSALRLITDTVGISLISVGVMDMQTLQKLEERGIHIVQGLVTEMIEIQS
ncbi:LapD/MoxY N-terminal periplasmic domain-containing protein [Sulfurimonas sp.]|uniref:LapD/MoxY N-terminal periplasmic domain-containing protein n=1 Tax=Sulfurimonas sp. TaxID=2022749 RepID=UPI00260E852F|nr:LapD/MoxY N-terminal periplasmic domain-containing protein [Sulfurimonas sp.]MCW8894569.1 diguanylate cyclase [Sulfurimonas sp.]MCW9067521.1 diguanylate cyclase [Sulfurimonas sp.]